MVSGGSLVSPSVVPGDASHDELGVTPLDILEKACGGRSAQSRRNPTVVQHRDRAVGVSGVLESRRQWHGITLRVDGNPMNL